MPGERVDLQKEPGRYVVKPVEGVEDWPFYWHAYIGDQRINGGLAQNHLQGVQEAKRAISVFRRNDWMQNYYYDTETSEWYKKGTLPPVK